MWTSIPHLQKDLSPVAALISVMVTRAWCLSVPQPPQWLDTTQNSCGPSWPWLQTQAWSLSFLPCSGWRRARPLLSRREESAWQALGSAPYTRLFLREVLPRRLPGRGSAVYLSWNRAHCPWPALRWLSAWRRGTDSGGYSSWCSAASWRGRRQTVMFNCHLGSFHEVSCNLFNCNYHSIRFVSSFTSW